MFLQVKNLRVANVMFMADVENRFKKWVLLFFIANELK